MPTHNSGFIARIVREQLFGLVNRQHERWWAVNLRCRITDKALHCEHLQPVEQRGHGFRIGFQRCDKVALCPWFTQMTESGLLGMAPARCDR
jgi:hypothetical protein